MLVYVQGVYEAPTAHTGLRTAVCGRESVWQGECVVDRVCILQCVLGIIEGLCDGVCAE
jgi:hypothetical protein